MREGPEPELVGGESDADRTGPEARLPERPGHCSRTEALEVLWEVEVYQTQSFDRALAFDPSKDVVGTLVVVRGREVEVYQPQPFDRALALDPSKDTLVPWR